MAKTLQQGQDNWERKMQNAGQKWKDRVQGQQNEYESGVADFLGVSEGEVSTGSDWSSGVDSVSASEFQNSVEGKGDKWARNVRDGLTR